MGRPAPVWFWPAGLLIICLSCALLLEVGIRVYFSFRVGPDVLLYGTHWHRVATQARFMRGQNVFEHENKKAGYSKYFPYQARRDVDFTGEAFDVFINGHGFRGPDYTIERPANTLRIITLGASSTFGFGNRDDETYPALLERLLNERLDSAPCERYSRAEVINLAIPHLNSRQIATLFRQEGVALKPDAITVYAGYNETRGLGRSGLLNRVAEWSLALNFVRVINEQSIALSQAEIEREKLLRKPVFLEGLQEIYELTRHHGIVMVPLTQQASALDPGVDARKGITYGMETRQIASAQWDGALVSALEGKLLIHADLMRALKEWSMERNLAVLDIMSLLDEHRYLLSTYVHLFPLGNELIALAIADQLATEFDCPSLAA